MIRHYPPSHSRSLLLFFLVVAAAAIFSGWLNISSVYAAGTINGTVYHDYNSSGTREVVSPISNNGGGVISAAVDNGVPNVTVIAYAPNGAVAGTAVTNAAGAYSVIVTGTGPYRLDFINLPLGYEPAPHGTDSPTTVTFVDDPALTGGVVNDINVGIHIPQEYCQDNPQIGTTCFVYGSSQGANATRNAVLSFPYSAGSDTNNAANYDVPTTHAVDVNAGDVGSVYGIAYARRANIMYTSSFMKKHSGFGLDGTGAVYAIDVPTNTTTLYADLNVIFGANTTGADPHNNADFDRDNGNATWDAVGKVSLGAITTDARDRYLYVMNLANRSIYRLPLTAAPTLANSVITPFPATMPGCANALDVRPFALSSYTFNGVERLYIGAVCSAESSQSAANLRAYVYTADPDTMVINPAPVLNISLAYTRASVNGASLATWRPWSPTFVTLTANTQAIYPQPWLTDIAFDRGNMILGFRDRNGDQTGHQTLDNPANALLYSGMIGGETLRACGNPALGWTLEANGSCGGVISAAGVATNQGPGGGEFYAQDDYFTGTPHDEASMGGITQVPGYPAMLTTAFDPIYTIANEFWDGGIRWYDNTTGNTIKAYRLYNGTSTNSNNTPGKGNGLGDLYPLCATPPLEIGNRVWYDDDLDGVQDPGPIEFSIPGVTVQLFDRVTNTVVATDVTDANGLYYFTNANVPGGILEDRDYRVQIDLTQAAIATPAYLLTAGNTGTGASPDINDSDGLQVGTIALVDFSTETAGHNDHTYDFGFNVVAPLPTPGVPGTGTGFGSGSGSGSLPSAESLTGVSALPATGESPFSGFNLPAVTLGLSALAGLVALILYRRG